jgi:hypothetical protein
MVYCPARTNIKAQICETKRYKVYSKVEKLNAGMCILKKNT